MLMAYRSAVQASTGHTPHLILYGREIRLPLDIIYRPYDVMHSRFEYPNEVRKTRTYKPALDRLNMAHERQKENLDDRS